MLVTLFGIVILVKFVQFANAEIPILVTLFGIVILFKLPLPENTNCPMLIKLLGTTNSITNSSFRYKL